MGSGTITSRIYMNNKLRDTKINQINNSGAFFAGAWVHACTLYQ